MQNENVRKAINVLKNGGVIIYPTETVYGLGADIFNQSAVEKVYALKGRHYDMPLSIAVRKEEIDEYAALSPRAAEFVDMFMPGPITLVLPKKENVPKWITQNEFIGVRVPENEIVKEIVTDFGAITTTSANPSGGTAPKNAEELDLELKNRADYVINTGKTTYEGASTIVKIVGDDLEILRSGVLNIEETIKGVGNKEST